MFLSALATPDIAAEVGKILGGALIVGGSAWGLVRKWSQTRRSDSVADAQAIVQVDSFQAYSNTIAMLNATVAQLRSEHEAASNRWRADMDALDSRLKQVSDQVDTAISRARLAEANVERLRAQLRGANMEPWV